MKHSPVKQPGGVRGKTVQLQQFLRPDIPFTRIIRLPDRFVPPATPYFLSVYLNTKFDGKPQRIIAVSQRRLLLRK